MKSPWYSTKNADRKRKKVTVTLAPEELEWMDEVQEELGWTRSAYLEFLIQEHKKKCREK